MADAEALHLFEPLWYLKRSATRARLVLVISSSFDLANLFTSTCNDEGQVREVYVGIQLPEKNVVLHASEQEEHVETKRER